MSHWNPYSNEGGTVVAISSDKFAVLAADTRMIRGYNILTRYTPRCFQLTESVVIGLAGYNGDCKNMIERVRMMIMTYVQTHNCKPDLKTIACRVSKLLYSKRFFPSQSFLLLAGIDRDGTGAVYHFDPVGSYQRDSIGVTGEARSLIQPFFDNQVMGKNMSELAPNKPVLDEKGRSNLPLDRVLNIVTDSFTSATERQIEVGDGLEIFVVRLVDTDEDMGVEDAERRIQIDVIRRPLKRD